ncbi:carboxypeptidase-like regulatory domain-containing protein [Paraflavitalea speifideaquila]|uniref:carboxypeptidase-like regulatory domain-containing protein n=1 Tax=Paraflavitalea speifideaquila TaxID=3076558 RepID=UPI0028F04C6F|nr:carboxypeptidase-like regulatory domain-containing protein [Paraflavitalea speifideiaquila]
MLFAPRFIRRCFGSLILLLFLIPTQAQKNKLTGTVVNTAENRKLHYSIVALINKSDSILYQSVRTNVEGAFELTKIPPGQYTLMVSFPKMADFYMSSRLQILLRLTWAKWL